MGKIKFSIVTVTYNVEKTIKETIGSVANQTYDNIEYIIVDGGSLDETLNIIASNSAYVSNYISESDNGIYDAMNKGLDMATGDYVLFLGADDVLYSPTVIEQVSKLMTSKDNVYYGNVIFNTSGRVYNGRYNRYKLALMNICHQAIFYPKHVYKEKRYDMAYKIFADYVYNISLFREHVRFVYMSVIITLFNTEGISSVRKDKNFFVNYKKLVRQNLGFGPYLLTVMHDIYKKIRELLLNKERKNYD